MAADLSADASADALGRINIRDFGMGGHIGGQGDNVGVIGTKFGGVIIFPL